jgi:hypothetical protein
VGKTFEAVRVERSRAIRGIDAVLREPVLEVDAQVLIAPRLGLAAQDLDGAE